MEFLISAIERMVSSIERAVSGVGRLLSYCFDASLRLLISLLTLAAFMLPGVIMGAIGDFDFDNTITLVGFGYIALLLLVGIAGLFRRS